MKFIRLGSLLISTILCSTSVFAGWQGNFLIGLEGGYAWRDGDSHLTILQPPPNNSSVTRYKGHRENGFIWGIFTGYQYTCNNWLGGLELKLGFHDIGENRITHEVDSAANHYALNAKHKREPVIGLSFRGGYYLTPWLLPYVRLGAETSSERLYLSAHNVTTGFAFDVEEHDRSFRFLAGLGAEVAMMACTTFRFEYNYSTKGRGAEATGFIPVSGQTLRYDLKPNQHLVSAAIVFNYA